MTQSHIWGRRAAVFVLLSFGLLPLSAVVRREADEPHPLASRIGVPATPSIPEPGMPPHSKPPVSIPARSLAGELRTSNANSPFSDGSAFRIDATKPTGEFCRPEYHRRISYGLQFLRRKEWEPAASLSTTSPTQHRSRKRPASISTLCKRTPPVVTTQMAAEQAAAP